MRRIYSTATVAIDNEFFDWAAVFFGKAERAIDNGAVKTQSFKDGDYSGISDLRQVCMSAAMIGAMPNPADGRWPRFFRSRLSARLRDSSAKK